MAKIGPNALQEVEIALARYRAEVEAAPLRPDTKKTYLLHAEHFVRWLGDDFTPGTKNSR